MTSSSNIFKVAPLIMALKLRLINRRSLADKLLVFMLDYAVAVNIFHS